MNDVEEALKKFMELRQARQDRLARERDAVLRRCTHGERAMYYTGVEHGLMVGGRQAEAAEIAADLEAAFGKA